jgi:hypothetical protein
VQGCNKVCKFACTFAHFGLFAMVQEVLLAPLKMMHNWAWFLQHVQGCKKDFEDDAQLCKDFVLCVRFQ